MAVINIYKNTCEVDSLYQWDNNQTLRISGLSLPQAPEVHFAHPNAEAAIVRQGKMDAAGVVTVGVPNSLLEKPYNINAYVCINTGVTFQTVCKVVIPVNGRAKPSDYEYIHEDVVLSLNALHAEMVALDPDASASVEKIINEDGTWTLRFSIPTGQNGATYIPTIDHDGVLSWEFVRMETDDPQVWPIPPAVNIVGPQGPNGPAGFTYIPEVNDAGWLTWSAVGGVERPDPVPSVYLPDLLGSSGGGMAPIDPPNSEIVSEAVQPDWNQNNPDASDYIKNRPFGIEPVEVLPLTVLLLSEGSAQLPSGFALQGDAEYEVNFNGVSYVCSAVDFSALGGIIYMGNDALMGNESARTEPFCIIYTVDDSACTLVVSDATAYSCSVSIVRRDTVKLHQRFLPYSPAMGDTLYWDGSIVGKDVTVSSAAGGTQIYVKVSDAVLTEAELINGVTIRENLAGSNVSSDFAGPLSFPEDGALWLGKLLPTVAIVGKDRGDLEAGIYFAVTVADMGLGPMEFKAASLTVPGCGKFNSCPTLPAEAMPKYLDGICVDKLILRSPVGKLFSLGISDEGQAQILPVGITD